MFFELVANFVFLFEAKQVSKIYIFIYFFIFGMINHEFSNHDEE